MTAAAGTTAPALGFVLTQLMAAPEVAVHKADLLLAHLGPLSWVGPPGSRRFM